MIERARAEQIFGETKSEWDGDNALQGLNLIEKYFPGKSILTGAEHDIIYSVDTDKLLEVISEEDLRKLSQLNWMLTSDAGDYISCFV